MPILFYHTTLCLLRDKLQPIISQMNHQKVPLLFLCAIGFFFASCNRDCENERIGETDYAPETIDHIQYTEGQSVCFEHENETLEFEVTLEPNLTSRLCTRVICRPSNIQDSNGCEYIEAPAHYFVLRSENTFLHFKAGIEVYTPESMEFYDWVEIGITSDFGNLFGGLITARNFEFPTINISNTVLQNELSMDSVSQLYTIADTLADIELFYDKSLGGITAFNMDGKQWSLKE